MRGVDRSRERDGSSGAWREVVDLHERAEGPPTLVGLHGDLAVAWIRADGTGRIHLQAPAETAIIERSRTYSGDVQGHPTALTRDHHTPFPYLGIVVLPSDWALPAGTTAGTLTAALDATLDEVADYWLEASHGSVEITSDVHPTVVSLPWTRRSRMTPPAWLGLAAGLVLAVLVGGRLLGPGPTYDSLAEEVIAHLDHEPGALRRVSTPVSARSLQAVIVNDVEEMDEPIGLITYARSCVINGRTVPGRSVTVIGDAGSTSRTTVAPCVPHTTSATVSSICSDSASRTGSAARVMSRRARLDRPSSSAKLPRSYWPE